VEHKERRGWVGGIVLILIGVLALASRFIPDSFALDFSVLLLGGMALAFFVAGVLTREAGWFFPAGIIGGVAGGIWATNSPLIARLGLDDGASFMLLFALGWATIPITTLLFSRERHWWPFILAAVFGIIGLGIAYGGVFMDMTNLLGYLWPLALIIGGALLIFRRRRDKWDGEAQSTTDESPPIEKHA
jgi:hypothetical protein